MTAVLVRGGGADVAFASSASTSFAGASVPASGVALAGVAPNTCRGEISADDLTFAVVAAMTLFGRCRVQSALRVVA